MVNKAYIKAISYYLPNKVLTNEEISKEFPEWSVEKVTDKVGIKERHVAADTETALDMAEKAVNILFQEYNINKNSIDFILLCTQSPDYFLPTSACILQDRLKLSKNCGAVDYNLGCSGYVYGLAMAKGLVLGGVAKNVLLITSETYTKHIHPKDKGNRTIFGDAASASIISDNGFAEIRESVLGTDGSGAENLIIKSGGLRQPEKANRVVINESDNPVSDDYLYMNGAEIFTFTLAEIPKLTEDTLKKNNLKIENVDLFVFHQANKYMLDFLRKKTGIPPNKFYYCIENVGNTVSSTIPIALKEALKESRLKGNVLLAGFGVGYSWGGINLYSNF